MANRKARNRGGFEMVKLHQRNIVDLRVSKDDAGVWHFFVDGAEVSGQEFVSKGGGLLLSDIVTFGLDS